MARARRSTTLLIALLAFVPLLLATTADGATKRAAARLAKLEPTTRQALCLSAPTARSSRARSTRTTATRGARRATARRASALRAKARVAATCDGAALPVVAGPRDPAAQRTLTLGSIVRGWRDGGAIGERLDVAASDGTRTVRVDVSWADAEPTRGTIDLSAYDARFRALADANMRAIILLDGTPDWAGASTDYAADPEGFARFTAAVVARYGPGGTFWAEQPDRDPSLAPVWFELWNEPYLPASSAGRRSPAAYGRLAKAAATAGRAANPQARFLIAGDTTVFDDVQGRWREWFTALFAETPGLRGAVQGIALHPYFRGRPDDYSPRSSRFASQFLRLDEVRRQLRRVGASDLPWFITEIGSATCRDLRSNYMCTTEAQQARNFRDTLAILRTRYAGNVRAVLAYRAEDLDYQGRGGDWDAFGSFGMRRLDGSAKPVLADYRRALLEG